MSVNGIYKEKELLLRIADGDEEAFETLYNSHVVSVSRIVYRMFPSESLTRDIVQEVFLKIWMARYKLENVQNISLYIYKIAYNCCFDYIRAEQRWSQAVHNNEQSIEQENTDGVKVVDLKETTLMISKAVSSLHPRSREIFQLNRTQGLKPGEIAEHLGISIQSVRNSLTRSTKQIRDYLLEHGINLPSILIIVPLPDILS